MGTEDTRETGQARRARLQRAALDVATPLPLGEDDVIAIVVPSRPERQSVLEALPGAQPEAGWDVPAWRAGTLLIVEPGVGPEKAAVLLSGLEGQDVDALWLFGWCGGLSRDLKVGDLVLAGATLADGASAGPQNAPASHPPDEAIRTHVGRVAGDLGLRLAVGPVLTSERVLATVADKRAGATTGAVAVEMEAGPLARWAVARSVPFVHLRVVLDPVASALPEVPLPADEHGNAPPHALLWYTLTHPREWPALWALMQQARTARRTMASVIAALTQSGGPLAP